MKLLTVMECAIEPLGYKSSSIDIKVANGMIQVLNNNKFKKKQLKNPPISKSKPECTILLFNGFFIS